MQKYINFFRKAMKGGFSEKEKVSWSRMSKPAHIQEMGLVVINAPNPRREFSRSFLPKDNLISYRGERRDPLTGMSWENVNQGTYGTCGIVGAGIGYTNYWDNRNGTTTFKFFKENLPKFVTITNTVDGKGQSKGDFGLLEKAYAAFLQEHMGVRDGWGDAVNGEFPNHIIDRLYGGFSSIEQAPDYQSLTEAVVKPHLIASNFVEPGYGLIPNHAYRIYSIGVTSTVLKNPWGIDGRGAPLDGVNDGFITVPTRILSMDNWVLTVKA